MAGSQHVERRMSLWLVRHAQPLIAPGSCYGQLDIPADPEQTLLAAQAAARALPLHARLRFSPLQRCEQLAEVLCRLRPDLSENAQPDKRLMEMHFGRHEGRLWADIPPHEMQAWTDDFAHHCFGGGERVAMFMARVDAAWADYRQAKGGSEVWVSHAGVARALALLQQGQREIRLASQWPQEGPGLGVCVCMER
jgi:alpha-ribazole phosphatase